MLLNKQLYYQDFQKISRTYLDILQLRDSIDKRLSKISTTNPSAASIKLLKKTRSTLEQERKDILKLAKQKFKNHLVWKYCKRVNGMGEVAALTFLGYLNPYKANTAGQARSYFGIAPQSQMKSGIKCKYNPEAKGRLWLIVRNIIMKKDSYYYPLYIQYKGYLLKREFSKYLKNPSLCPRYQICNRRLLLKANRLNRLPKVPPCKKHLDNMAKRYLAGLVLSHVLELMRQNEGLPTQHFKEHKNYIGPKP